MKKLLLVGLLCAGGALTSQAVLIHWSAETTESFDAANLVWIADTTPTAPEITAAFGTYVDSATGAGIVSGSGVYTRLGTDSTERSSGYYCVVLFNGGSAVAYSTTVLAWNDTALNAIGNDPFNPPTGTFTPTSWQPVPEPCSLSLMCLGAAAIAIRRRRRKLAA